MASVRNAEDPQTRKEFFGLIKKHRSLRITWDEAVVAGACDDIETFQGWYFPGRREVRLRELLPFVTYEHAFDYDVKRIIVKIFVRRGILVEDYVMPQVISQDARQPLPDWYYVNEQ